MARACQVRLASVHLGGAKHLKVRGQEDAMIKKVSGGYKVVSKKTGKNLGGPYKTKEEAKTRLRQVEFFKHRGK